MLGISTQRISELRRIASAPELNRWQAREREEILKFLDNPPLGSPENMINFLRECAKSQAVFIQRTQSR